MKKLILIASLLFSTVCAQETKIPVVFFNWDSNPEADIAGYKIYWSTEPGVYTDTLAVGNTNSVMVTNGFGVNTLYFVAFTAVDAQGNESGFSPEVSFKKEVDTDAPSAPLNPLRIYEPVSEM